MSCQNATRYWLGISASVARGVNRVKRPVRGLPSPDFHPERIAVGTEHLQFIQPPYSGHDVGSADGNHLLLTLAGNEVDREIDSERSLPEFLVGLGHAGIAHETDRLIQPIGSVTRAGFVGAEDFLWRHCDGDVVDHGGGNFKAIAAISEFRNSGELLDQLLIRAEVGRNRALCRRCYGVFVSHLADTPFRTRDNKYEPH